MKLGEDTYVIVVQEAPLAGGIAGAREMALKGANEKCDSLGSKITVTDIDSRSANFWSPHGSVAVKFVCK